MTFTMSFYVMRRVTDRVSRRGCTNDLLASRRISSWFSEKDVGLGAPLIRATDKGLVNSRIGLALMTRALLRLPRNGIADRELSVLLVRNQPVPIVHNTTHEARRAGRHLVGQTPRVLTIHPKCP